MCGIAGFIGPSNCYDTTYSLITELFNLISIRGEDASGFWGTGLRRNTVLYQKEPIKSKIFTGISPYWHLVKKCELDLCLTHARLASLNYGRPSYNFNNHPFISNNGALALIHNGKVDQNVYKRYKKIFRLKSKCDSELYLKFIQMTDNILDGIVNIQSYLENSSYAIAIGKRIARHHKKLFLFRNTHRPLFLIDVKDLNQYFFVSTQEIWNDALQNLNLDFKNCKIKELEPLQATEITLFNNKLSIKNHSFGNLFETKLYLDTDTKFKLITGLDENDNMNFNLENKLK